MYLSISKAVQDMKDKARKEGRLETLGETLKNVMESLHLTVEEAMIVMKVDTEDQLILKKMI